MPLIHGIYDETMNVIPFNNLELYQKCKVFKLKSSLEESSKFAFFCTDNSQITEDKYPREAIQFF